VKTVIFMGSSDFAVPSLRACIEAGYEILSVYTREPKPAGRGLKLQETPVARFAKANNIKVYTPKSLKPQAEIDKILHLKPDVIAVAAYGLILPQAVLDIPRYGCINVHASLLPRWRGAAPIHRAIMAGDRETGVSIMKMSAGLDEGDVYAKAVYPLTLSSKLAETHDALAEIGAKALIENFQALYEGSAKAEPQFSEAVTYAEKISKSEAKIDFTQPAEAVLRKIHGLSPWPGAFFTVGGERFKVIEAELIDDQNGEAGVFVDQQLTVACGAGCVRFKKIQKAGSAPLVAVEFLKNPSSLITGIRTDQ
jgi:methionyl-tRNA formyltransferase